jgi:hypothetical protein
MSPKIKTKFQFWESLLFYDNKSRSLLRFPQKPYIWAINCKNIQNITEVQRAARTLPKITLSRFRVIDRGKRISVKRKMFRASLEAGSAFQCVIRRVSAVALALI